MVFVLHLNEVNDLDLGIIMGDVTVSILMYADDIMLVSDTENNLQTVLTLYMIGANVGEKL